MMASISMISIHPSTLLSSSSSISSKRLINAAIRIPKLNNTRGVNNNNNNNNMSLPKIPSSRDLVQDYVSTTYSSKKLQHNNNDNNNINTLELLAILEAVAERAEIHKNVGEQRDNWNNLLLNSINMITLAAATMVAIADTHAGATISALNLSSTLLFSAATGMLLAMNKIQPSQLAEEQRKATRSFRQLQTQIETTLALGVPTEEDVKTSIAKILAIEKAYPLPLLGGAMLEKFPAKYEPAVWWPRRNTKTRSSSKTDYQDRNGWSEELEMELREVIEVVKTKDMEDYERLGNKALKANKTLAIAGPLFTAIAALGSVFVGMNGGGSGSCAGVVSAVAGSMAAVVNAFEHGGQVGMVFEMYRNCGGFFKLLEETVEATLEENDFDKRENGQVFELKVALQLGRSVSQLRELASKSASCRAEGIAIDEFASKMF